MSLLPEVIWLKGIALGHELRPNGAKSKDWLCFFVPPNQAIYHIMFISKNLRQFQPKLNWLCFAKLFRISGLVLRISGQRPAIGFVFSLSSRHEFFIIPFHIRPCAIFARPKIGFVFSNSFSQYASRNPWDSLRSTQYELIGFVFSKKVSRHTQFSTFFGLILQKSPVLWPFTCYRSLEFS